MACVKKVKVYTSLDINLIFETLEVMLFGH